MCVASLILSFDNFQLAKEAFECEEKEERLVSDAVKHLTEANVQVCFLIVYSFPS